MKTSSVLIWSVGLLFANMVLWLIFLSLYLSQHPEVIQFSGRLL